MIRSNNGTKYTSNKFNLFWAVSSIEHQLTTTYTLQQYGVSERKNRTIIEMARCLLFEKKLPKKFWVEVVNSFIYLHNTLLTKALKGKTPFETWNRYKPSMQHLRIFCCICYAHVLEVKKDKLHHKENVEIMIGYNNVTKGYKIYQLSTGKVIVGKDKSSTKMHLGIRNNQ